MRQDHKIIHLQSSLESCHLDKEDKGVTRFFPMIFLLMLHSKPSCVRWPCVITRLCYLYCQRTGTEGLGKGNSNHKIIQYYLVLPLHLLI